MSTQTTPPSKKDSGQKSSIPTPVAIGVLVVALVVVFFVFLRPMIFPGNDFGDLPPLGETVPGMEQPAIPGMAPEMPPVDPGMPPMTDPGAPVPPPTPDDAAAPAPVAVPQDVDMAPQPGEIVVSGTISRVDFMQERFFINVTEVHIEGQQPTQVSAGRAKEIVVDDATSITINGESANLNGLQRNLNVSVVGPNYGEGQPLVARAVTTR